LSSRNARDRAFCNMETRTGLAETPEFPPLSVRAIVQEVGALLKERKETVSVAETVCFLLIYLICHFFLVNHFLRLFPSFVATLNINAILVDFV
jgi:hypothetical protein